MTQETQDGSITPAVTPVCSRCGATGGYIRRRAFSAAEVGDAGNPMLCVKCHGRYGR